LSNCAIMSRRSASSSTIRTGQWWTPGWGRVPDWNSALSVAIKEC